MDWPYCLYHMFFHFVMSVITIMTHDDDIVSEEMYDQKSRCTSQPIFVDRKQ